MYAKRMQQLRSSFIRDILNVIEDEKTISFAGGLPNPELFPLTAIAAAAKNASQTSHSLQYSTTEGHQELRQYIARRYYSACDFDENNILITNGSQQALDLLGKLFIDSGDKIMIEAPGYLGAIQAFSVYEPTFIPIDLRADGLDLAQAAAGLQQDPKLLYTVPNFQNPTGISYSEENKQRLLALLKDQRTYLIEDDPYRELQYQSYPVDSMIQQAPQQVIGLGSFSKIFAPAMRLGWVAAKREIIEKLILLKQSADLHTNYFSQCVLYDYLQHNDIEAHIETIKADYSRKLTAMQSEISRLLPATIQATTPKGGMFVWLTLPPTMDAFELLKICQSRGLLFVPGSEFYFESAGRNTLRLNFSNATVAQIQQGIAILAEGIAAVDC